MKENKKNEFASVKKVTVALCAVLAVVTVGTVAVFVELMKYDC